MSTSVHIPWMQAAFDLARQALPHDVPVGALVISADGTVVGQGYNRREVDHDPAAHAEILALRQAGETRGNWRLTDCTLYVTLEPCPMCASAIVQARIAHVVFGASDPLQGALGSVLHLGQNTMLQVTAGVLEDSCQSLLHDFFQQKRTQTA